MNLRDLRYVLAVAEFRHFGKAAEASFVSQPTLSGQIKKMEDELGVTIFERSNRSVEITPIGEQLLIYARRVIEQVEAMENLAKAAQDPLAGPLRLGVIPTLGPYLMPLILLPLRKDFPQLHLVLREEITSLLLDHLRRHELDAALIATPPDDDDLQEIPLFDEPFWLAHPAKHPLYNKDEIYEEDLPVDQLLLLADGHCLTEQVMGVCHLDQSAGHDDLRASSLETLMQLVGAGFGCTLVPALALRSSWATDTGVILRQVNIANAERRVRLVARKTFPRALALKALARLINRHLPNTVRRIEI
ncbi:MAG: LysR family transcriptional regulator [Chromatiales bacterium]|nr:LysR family transcriptional regulator [Gammaproteobacteria bacterium]MCP5352720.1 LysR family transcriptional regulator [Chromatiales bacterium]